MRSIVGLQTTMQKFISVLLSPVPEREFRSIIRENFGTIAIESFFSPRAFQIIQDQKIQAGTYGMKREAATEPMEIITGSAIDKNEEDLFFIPEKQQPAKQESLHVPYASLVITAPFLPMFFDAVGLLADGRFTNMESQIKAVRLTGFLGSGQADTPDWELVMPKLLCGLDPDTTITMDEELDQDSLLEADNLLKALIKHWNALGHCSTDGLREGFLDRNGKLTTQPDNWLVQVESKSIDILLDKISWGFSTIKLPWMPKMIITEWKT